MNALKIPVFTFLVVAFTGCQTTPPVTSAPQNCPILEAVACPACEIQQCPKQDIVEETISTCKPAPPAVCDKVHIESRYQTIGEMEWALVEPGDLVFETRIDTGAETSSIHAEDIQLIEKDGKRWVRFKLSDPKTGLKIPLERRLHRRIVVKRKTQGALDQRFVVRMWITIGNTRTWLDVSLSDRKDFDYPLLIGRNMLMDNFVVDVSRHHTLPKPTDQSTGQ
ncbi:MAG: hypothetical protein ACI89U_001750 [Gammaproteobacteria bacterium]|jgi:hypothetical protein